LLSRLLRLGDSRDGLRLCPLEISADLWGGAASYVTCLQAGDWCPMGPVRGRLRSRFTQGMWGVCGHCPLMPRWSGFALMAYSCCAEKLCPDPQRAM